MILKYFAAVLLSVVACVQGQELPPVVDFPTANHALIGGRPEDFYMYVERDFEGVKSKPWEGGQYGFVRGPVRVGGRVVYAQVHEGIDIKPLQRDASGNPLDPVLAAATGQIVHVSRDANASNYGRYVVMEHMIGGCPYYTVYGHLAEIDVEVGQALRQGQRIGMMGFTGAGIDRERAHTHFEFCMMLSRNFEAWYAANFPRDPNRHGLYNGRNLVGLNVADLLIAARREGAAFSIPAFVRSDKPFFKATVKHSPHLKLVQMYPWLVTKTVEAPPEAWTISFTRYGVPIAAEPAVTAVDAPVLEWVRPQSIAYIHVTRGLIAGSTGRPRLSDSGKRFLSLLTYPD